MSLTAFLPTGAPQVLPFIGVPGAATVGHALVWSESPQGFALAPVSVGPDQFSGVLPVAKGGWGTNTGSFTSPGAITLTAGGTNQNITVKPSGTGMIGLGTTSPLLPIDIRGNTRIAGASGVVGVSPYPLSVQSNGSQTWLEILNNGGSGRGAFFGMVGNDFHLWNYQGGDTLFYNGTAPGSSLERLRITRSGNVGIGTSTPTSALTIASTNPGSALTIADTTPTTSATSGCARFAGGIGISGGVVAGGVKINFANLPTSETGLAVGDLWRDGNIVKVKI